ATARYREFVLDPAAASYDPWSQVLGQIYLGSASFAEAARAETKVPEKDRDVPRTQREPVPPSVAEVVRHFEQAFELTLADRRQRPRILTRERAILAGALRRHARATLPAIGEALGVEVSRAAILARRDAAEGAGKEVLKKLAALERSLAERKP
ncbi:MAG: hypothetical protein HY900_17230, partial [Deltaproteobacteria bacterium]|nr:hypothetical protein [Deltaproteobacteria bacterium]